MLIYKKSDYTVKRIIAVLLCFYLIAALSLTFTAYAEKKESKVVRVGWYDSPAGTKDENGQRTGYDYFYEQKIAAYTGWTYEYVEGTKPELMKMLINGDIDMLGDIVYTDELAESLLFPSQPMGTEDYYVFVSPDNKELTGGSLSVFNDKKIGVKKDSYEQSLFEDWAKRNKISVDLTSVSFSEDQALEMLQSKELDAVVIKDFLYDRSSAVPVCKIGSSDYYFAVNKQSSDIFDELEMVLNQINEENRYFNQQMHEKYVNSTGANLYLNDDEKKWLAAHGTIKVGYVDNYLPFCDKDEETQKMTGALSEYLEYASSVIKNADLRFDSIYFATLEDALKALDKGYINCVFPANISEYDAENMGLALTPSIMTAEIYEIVKLHNRDGFGDSTDVKAGINNGDVNYEKVLAEKFSDWEKVVLSDEDSCLHAVANGNVDTFLTSNYRYNIIAKQCEKMNLTGIGTGMTIEFSFAATRGETELYSILNKTVGMVPSVKTNSLMTKYIFEKDKEPTMAEFIQNHLAEVFEIVAGVLLVILILTVRSIHAMKRARKSEELIASAQIDKVTGIYSKNFLFEYAAGMQKRAKGRLIDTIVIDIERFHSINSLNSREFGDKVLSTLGEHIKTVFNEEDTIAGRIDADIFCIFCWSLDNYEELLMKLQTEVDELLPSVRIRLRMGVLPAKSNETPENMYELARIACNMARGRYDKLQLIVYDDTVGEERRYEQRLINDLKRAVKDDEFEVYYQPQYDIQCEKPRLKSAEALVRWHHPELGMVKPSSFIPLFERNGVIGEVDKCVWKKAVCQVAEWKRKYGKVLPVSVNLSRMDIFDPNLKEILESMLKDNDLDHDAIKLEVTESAYTENADQVISIVKELRQNGFEIELDDFGTGYSSLGMLASLPIDIIKMDRSFIVNMHTSDAAVQMVKLIIDLAKEMEMDVIAEGVEDKNEMIMLKEMGCDIVQGYYFSKPLSMGDFEKLLVTDFIH